MRHSGLNKRRELRSELAMKARAMAREMLMRFWQASLRILPIKSLTWPIAFWLASLSGEC